EGFQFTKQVTSLEHVHDQLFPIVRRFGYFDPSALEEEQLVCRVTFPVKMRTRRSIIVIHDLFQFGQIVRCQTIGVAVMIDTRFRYHVRSLPLFSPYRKMTNSLVNKITRSAYIP